jgi:hypothetical protein
MPGPSDPSDPGGTRRQLCEELARLAATPRGLRRVLRLLQGARGGQRQADAPSVAAMPGGEPAGTPPRSRRSAPPVYRVCLLGESAAAGMFHRPRVTPAGILAERLQHLAAPGRCEVIDLAAAAQTDEGLVAAAQAALRWHPAILVAFAGNNWIWGGLGSALAVPAEAAMSDLEDAAAALARQGAAGLKALAERRLRQRAGHTIDRVAGIARSAGVPLVWVIPEVNLPDVEVAHPVYWLPGDGVRRWYRLHRRASGLLERGEIAAAAGAAMRLTALDGGACAASQGLLARALRELGQGEAARAACRAQIDAATWDPRFGRSSGVNSAILDGLRAGCRRHGLASVDLPVVFAQVCAPSLPGRRLFLDHCHLTLEGMSVAMAAVAAAVAPLLLAGTAPAAERRRVAATPPAPASAAPPQPLSPPATEALAQLQAGIYNANLDYRHWSWIEDLFTAALGAGGELRDAARDYLLARAAPCRPSLTAACRRNLASAAAFDPRVWEPTDLGGELLQRLSDVWARLGGDPAREIAAVWIEQNPMPREGIELAASRHRQLLGLERGAEAGGRRAIFRALAPASVFHFIADGRRDLEVELTGRVPAPQGAARTGVVRLSVNGHRLASFRLAAGWQRRTGLASRGQLRAGINRVVLEWPPPAAAGDAALSQAVKRLRLGMEADLYPVFGEVFSLRARPRAGR